MSTNDRRFLNFVLYQIAVFFLLAYYLGPGIVVGALSGLVAWWPLSRNFPII